MEDAYRPKIDWVFWSHAGSVVVLLALVSVFLSSIDIFISIPSFLLFLLMLAYVVLIVRRTKYTLSSTGIVIQNATAKYEISYADVKKITNTNRDLINYGIFVLSLDRVGIRYGKAGHIMISPADKQGFLTRLRSRCRNAIYEEDLKPIK
ncbi:MAG: PH domain-containing protein [Candidatus Methanoplasma sp.]|jgi:hypothetical protein|nr:PH domain-containing protein [Candidatus Methanoplasma sp.]